MLEKLELQQKPVVWECDKCHFSSTDQRKYPTTYFLTISEAHKRQFNIQSVLEYNRTKKCSKCNFEVNHRARKDFNQYPKHLILVPVDPKAMRILISEDDSFKLYDKSYSLIGTTLHYGDHFRLGHYIALVKDGNRWFECNDSHVHEIRNNRETQGSYHQLTNYGWSGSGNSNSRSGFSRYDQYTPTLLVYERDN